MRSRNASIPCCSSSRQQPRGPSWSSPRQIHRYCASSIARRQASPVDRGPPAPPDARGQRPHYSLAIALDSRGFGINCGIGMSRSTPPSFLQSSIHVGSRDPRVREFTRPKNHRKHAAHRAHSNCLRGVSHIGTDADDDAQGIRLARRTASIVLRRSCKVFFIAVPFTSHRTRRSGHHEAVRRSRGAAVSRNKNREGYHEDEIVR